MARSSIMRVYWTNDILALIVPRGPFVCSIEKWDYEGTYDFDFGHYILKILHNVGEYTRFLGIWKNQLCTWAKVMQP